MRRCVGWVVLGTGVFVCSSCGAPQKQSKTENDRTVVEKLDHEWTPESETWQEGDSSDSQGFSDRVDMRDLRDQPGRSGSGAESGSSSSGEPSPATDYEMTYNDCTVLAGHYYKVILQEQVGKIPDGLKAAQRSAAENKARDNADKGKTQWLNQCTELVGSAYNREWLTCGMNATTVKGFTDCVTGAKQ